MKKLLYLFVMLFVLQGCTTEEVIEDYITLEESSLSCDEHANTLTLQFSATTKWEAEVVDQNKNNWVTISPTSGEAGESTITIQTKNNSTTESRYATICITVGTIQQTVTITQKQNDVIVLAEGEYTLDKEGEVFELELQANVDITVSIPDNDKNWIEFVESRAVSDKILCFNIAANTTGKERKSTITISGGNATQTINVTQESLLPSNQIWYTSTDEQPLSKDFGTGLQSHTYENGKGVLIFNDDVTAITEGMFDNCETLATISLPNNVTAIEAGAFFGCSSLESINVPDGVTEIGASAFNSCINLTSISLGSKITEISSQTFGYCKSLTSITIPNSVTYIGNNAFQHCSSLTTITIPDSVTEIDDSAFYNCSSLTSITIPDGVTAIGISVFNRCVSLTSITIPDSVTEIGMSAFYGCESLTSITIPDSVTTIGNAAFRKCSNLTAINIPNSVTAIGEDSFQGCNSLKSVVIGNNVAKIGRSAFSGSISLDKLTIPESVAEIGKNAFYGCTVEDLTINGSVVEAPYTGILWHQDFTFKKLTIGGNITKIGERAFAGCKVETLEILNGVTAIESNAFYNCGNLTSVTMPSSITIVYAEAFKNCGNVKRVDISDLAAWCKTEFRENPANPLYSGKAKLYLNNEEITELTIPSDVTVIKAHAFTGCSNNLKCVTIPESVTEIGERAFCDCNTDELIINSNLTSNNRGWLDYFNFKKCTIGGNVTNIKEDAFLYCNSVKSVNILNGVSNIGNGAFRGCTNLTDVNIPESVSSMGIMIFNGCSNLKNVYCKPTTPPSLGVLSFDNNASDRKIYVPQESVEAYKNADGWSNYADAIVGYDF